MRIPRGPTLTLPIAISVLALAQAPPAAADTLALAGSAPPLIRRSELRIGALLGGTDVGDVSGSSGGIHLGLGHRLGDFTFSGEYQYLGVDEDGPENDGAGRHGRTSRLGASARYLLVGLASEAPIGVDFWGEIGGAWEHVSWTEGGVLDRPALSLGFGMDIDGRPGRDGGRPRHTGLFVAFRASVARGPRPDGEPTCGGPCDRATLPSRADTSLYLSTGWHFGR
jgi:hypothetical protein